MERTAVAFAPGHISGYFRRVDGDTPAATGSCGAGCVIDRGVCATVTPAARTTVTITDTLPEGDRIIRYGSALIEELLESLGVSARVETAAGMPIGAGFGMSAAAILATLTATNAVFALEMSPEDIAKMAHAVEVSHNTGLGDVAAAAGGGVVIRNGPGLAGVSRRMFPDTVFWAVTFGSIFTPDIIGSPEQMRRVTAAFPAGEPQTIPEFLQVSREFAEASGLIPGELRPVLDACDRARVPASMTMLGCGVFAEGPAAGAVLSRFGTAVPLKIYPTGPVLLEVR